MSSWNCTIPLAELKLASTVFDGFTCGISHRWHVLFVLNANLVLLWCQLPDSAEPRTMMTEKSQRTEKKQKTMLIDKQTNKRTNETF